MFSFEVIYYYLLIEYLNTYYVPKLILTFFLFSVLEILHMLSKHSARSYTPSPMNPNIYFKCKVYALTLELVGSVKYYY